MSDASRPILLAPNRVAERLNIGRTKVFELMARGELESVSIGRCRRIPLDALEAYVARLRAARGADGDAS